MKIIVRDLLGNVINSISNIDGEDAEYSFDCILEQESWVEDELLAISGLNPNHFYVDSNQTDRTKPLTAVVGIYQDQVLRYKITLE